MAEKANVAPQQLYDQRIFNIGKVCRSNIPKYCKAWKEIQKEHGFSEEASEFWTDLKECKEPFDKFVHQDSYDDVKQLSFVELQTTVAKEVFVGDRAKFEPSFQFFLKVNKELSDALGLSLYSYPAPQKRNPAARNNTKATERW